MRFTSIVATLAVLLVPSILAQDENTTEAVESTTTITRTVIQATATSTIVRSSNSDMPTSTYSRPSKSTAAATQNPTPVPAEIMAGASMEQGSFVVAALAGAAVIAFGL